MAAADQIAVALTQHDKVRRSTDIPLFYGRKDKDTISPQQLIERICRAARVAHWADDESICDEFYLCLREQAISWSNTLYNIPGFDRNDWASVKAEFLAAYAPKYTARTLCTSFHDLKQAANETVQDFYNRVSEVFRDAFLVLPDHVTAHAGTAEDRFGLTAVQAHALMKIGISNMILLMMNTMFTGGLREEIRNKVLEKGPSKIQETVTLAREIEIIHRDKREKAEKGSYVAAIGDDDPSMSLDSANYELLIEPNEVPKMEHVNAIRRQMNKPPLRYQVKSGSYTPRPSGSNAAKASVICRFCKIKGHFQRECRKRLAAGAPQVDPSGRPYANSQSGGAAAISGSTINNISSPYQGMLHMFDGSLNM